MGRSTIQVAETFLDNFIKGAKLCGFEYLGKVAYNKEQKSYTVTISGPNVPDAQMVTATFHRLRGGAVAVEFKPAFNVVEVKIVGCIPLERA